MYTYKVRHLSNCYLCSMLEINVSYDLAAILLLSDHVGLFCCITATLITNISFSRMCLIKFSFQILLRGESVVTRVVEKHIQQEGSQVMYPFQKGIGTPRSQAGSEQDHDGQKLSGTSLLPTNLPASLTPVDMDQLRARLISVPGRPQPNQDVLVFPHRTKAQERQWAAQRPAQFEMLVRAQLYNKDFVYALIHFFQLSQLFIKLLLGCALYQYLISFLTKDKKIIFKNSRILYLIFVSKIKICQSKLQLDCVK